LVGGTFIMSFFGISIAGLRITGGILLVGIGLDMLRSKPSDASEKEQREAAKRKNDISFSPLAMPMLSGPGSIAVTLGFTSLASRWSEYAAIIAGIVAVALITYFVLRVAGRLVKFVGPVGVNALTRIMGFLLMSIGVQFVVNGMIDPELLRALRAAWDSR
jgi:multiple antibiotic resistance protein